jgi:hypothetical protein
MQSVMIARPTPLQSGWSQEIKVAQLRNRKKTLPFLRIVRSNSREAALNLALHSVLSFVDRRMSEKCTGFTFSSSPCPSMFLEENKDLQN